MFRNTRTAIMAGTFCCAAILSAIPALADDPPRSYAVSPDVYKVAAERDQTRVILVTWKPGQRDEFHSHPAAAGYFLTDCNMRFYYPDGRTVDQATKVGRAFVQPAIASHSGENRGDTDCKIVMFERE